MGCTGVGGSSTFSWRSKAVGSPRLTRIFHNAGEFLKSSGCHLKNLFTHLHFPLIRGLETSSGSQLDEKSVFGPNLATVFPVEHERSVATSPFSAAQQRQPHQPAVAKAKEFLEGIGTA